jgi:hypothetical protein
MVSMNAVGQMVFKADETDWWDDICLFYCFIRQYNLNLARIQTPTLTWDPRLNQKSKPQPQSCNLQPDITQ